MGGNGRRYPLDSILLVSGDLEKTVLPTFCPLCYGCAVGDRVVMKGKVCPRRGHEGSEVEWSTALLFPLTTTSDGGGWLTPLPGRFTSGNDTRYSYRRLGGAWSPSGRVWKISPSPGIYSRTVQPVASRYTVLSCP